MGLIFGTILLNYIIESLLSSRDSLVVNGITRDQLLSEIRLSDDKDIQETSLYKLSSAKGLEWFDVVVFTGSSQDWYSPIESALIQMSDRIKDSHIYADLK